LKKTDGARVIAGPRAVLHFYGKRYHGEHGEDHGDHGGGGKAENAWASGKQENPLSPNCFISLFLLRALRVLRALRDLRGSISSLRVIAVAFATITA
jgi:hypothetical protein